MTDSILDSIKKLLGIEAEYVEFDTDIIIHINTVFAVAHQVGVGDQSEPFVLVDKDQVWEDFVQGATQINMVKTYVYLKVKLAFDPPSTSFGTNALKDQILEYEARLNYLEGLFVTATTD